MSTFLFFSVCNVVRSSKQALYVHQLGHRPKSHQNACAKCPTKVFATKRQLTAHLVTHLPPMHQCDYCEKKFKNIYNLQKHLKICRLNPQRIEQEGFTCDICKGVYSTKSNLVKHMKKATCSEIN